jgi:TRAP-type C4-dicarboxylate transport system permease small subunit
VSYLLCPAIFLTVPELTRRRVHVAINLLIDRASPSVAGALHYLIRASGAAACMLATWISANETLSQFNRASPRFPPIRSRNGGSRFSFPTAC